MNPLRLIAVASAAAALLLPAGARALGATFSSRLSEEDARNWAQALAPQGATVTGMQVRPFSACLGYGFTCQVTGNTAPGAQPTGMPILFGRVWS